MCSVAGQEHICLKATKNENAVILLWRVICSTGPQTAFAQHPPALFRVQAVQPQMP